MLAKSVASPGADVVNLDGSSGVVSGLKAGMRSSANGIGFTVPQAGVRVNAEAMLTNGQTIEVAVDSRADGSVVVHKGAEAEPVGMVSGVNPCADPTHSIAGPKWNKTYSWVFNAGSTPSIISASGAESALKTSVSRIVNGYNNCGQGDAISATHSYAGRTTSLPDISTSAACLSLDRKSEMGFAALPSGMVGMTCWWSLSGEIIEGDIMFNKNIKWYLKKPRRCSSRWSLHAAAAHEIGHLYGLNHVSEADHGSLTMSPKIMSCQKSEVTLGLGDLKGLEALY
ncbi:MAG: M10 family metallopeptidase domain-containing protein [Actinomycetota bacterium]|nr:M10 family metallopeptidase domain-containing protein [Actinomycetota bacterium]